MTAMEDKKQSIARRRRKVYPIRKKAGEIKSTESPAVPVEVVEDMAQSIQGT